MVREEIRCIGVCKDGTPCLGSGVYPDKRCRTHTKYVIVEKRKRTRGEKIIGRGK